MATKIKRTVKMAEQIQPNYQMTDTLSVAKSTLYQKSQLAPYNPDDLVQRFGTAGKGLDKYESMLVDDAVKAGLITKKSAIVASGWQIIPADDTPQAKEMAEWIENQLRESYNGNFDASLYEMLDAFEYGFTVTEKIYDIVDGMLILKELKTRPSQSFEFHCDDKGYLKPDGLKQWTMNAMISLPQDKCIIYSYDKKRDNLYGTSDLRSAYRAWFSKDFTIKMMNIAIERMGNPLVVAKYPKNASPEDRDKLMDIADNISGKTSISIPVEATFEFIQAPSNMDLFQKAIEIYNIAIMKAILLPEKMGFGGDTGGSYALGKVQQNTYLWILEKIRNELETLIHDQLIKQIVDYNFGLLDKYPKFKWKPLSEENKDEKAKIIIDAISRGSLINDLATENFLRGLIGLPEKMEEEADDTEEPEEENKDTENEPKSKSSNDGSDDDDTDDIKDGKKEFKLRRKPNTYELKVNFEKINKDMDETTVNAMDNLRSILEKIRDDFTNQIIRKKIMENKNIEAVKSLEFKYIRDYALECESFLRKSYTDGKKTSIDIHKTHRKSFAKATSNIGLVKSKALTYIKESARFLAGTISGKYQNMAKKIVSDGVANGTPLNLIVEKVDNVFAPLVAQISKAGYDYDGKSLYTPVNTEIAKAYNAGMQEYNKELEDSGEIVAYEWSSILDSVTTEGCNDLDGMIFEVTSNVWSDLGVPRHYNCRSLMIPIYRDEEYVADETTEWTFEW